MKRFFLNPNDIAIGICLFIFGILFDAMFLGVMLPTMLESSFPRPEIIMLLSIINLIALVPAIYGLVHFFRFRGSLYLYDHHIVIKKGRKKVKFDISQIRRISIKYYNRKGGRLPTREIEYQYSIYLCEQKQKLDFLITNPIMLTIIRKHHIHFTPGSMKEQIYLPGEDQSQSNSQNV